MTPFVVFIVLLHALPVLAIAMWTKSKFALTFAAIVSGGIGIATGSPAYAAADVLGVAIAFVLGIGYVNRKESSQRHGTG